MKKIMIMMAIAVTCVFVLMSGVSQATPIYGSLWKYADASAQNPSIVPAGSATATFTVTALNFDSGIGTLTYDTWLKGSNSTNPNNLVWLTDPSNIKNTFYTAGGQGTFFQFTGIAYFPANVVISHDDGIYLTLGTTVYNDSAPTTVKATPLNNLAGTYAFTLNYGAWNGFPEVLKVPGISVPEPATMFLFGLGLLGLAGLRRRLKK